MWNIREMSMLSQLGFVWYLTTGVGILHNRDQISMIEGSEKTKVYYIVYFLDT